MTASRAALALACGCFALAGCSEVTQNEPLPWLRVKKTQHKDIGGFGGGSSQYDYYVKRFGFVWTKLEEPATGTVIALDPNTAAISTTQGLKLLQRGADQGILACGSNRSAHAVVAQAGVVDCFDVVAGPAAALASQIRWRRISGAGEALVVEKVSVESANRLFARAMASFYDSGHQPYFVTMNADQAQPPECALVWIAGGETRSIAAPPEISRGECADTEPWARVMKRTLRKA